MRRYLIPLAALLELSARETVAHAGGGAATESYEGITDGAVDLHGLADVFLQGSLDRPSRSTNDARAFDARNNLPTLGALRLTVAHKPDVFGFRVDADVGAMQSLYLRIDPAATTHPGASLALSYLEQAFVTAKLPVGPGLQIDVGKVETPVGFEDNEALQNWNYSRSLLYLLGEPSYHAGMRLTCALTKTLAVSAYWVNGWDTNVVAGDGMRAAAAALTWEPVSRLELVAVYMGGLERAPTRPADPALSFRNELDVYAKYKVAERLDLAVTGDYGEDAAKGGVSWWGVGTYVRAEVLPWLAGAVRAERYDDGAGFTSGTRQRLAEITATVELRGQFASTTWIGRLELRRDASDEPFFATGTSIHQDTLGASLLAAF